MSETPEIGKISPEIFSELGIPAVISCGDATLRLHTGDKVRVDGTQGTVEILETVEKIG